MNLLAIWLLLQAPPSQGELVREARQSLTRAEQAATRSGEVCRSGEWEKCTGLLSDTQKGVEHAKEALDKTGINPQRSPRHFKDAEIRTRKILKLLRALASYIHPDDQRKYETVVGRVSEINDQLLSSVVEKKESKKKKK
jgi:hypothetical protein